MTTHPGPVIIGVCGACAGQGMLPAETFEHDGAFVTCDRCDGLGDLDALRLKAAYDAGAAEGLRRMRSVVELATASLRALERHPEPRIDRLKRHVGIAPMETA